MNFSENLEVLQARGEDKLYFRCKQHNYWGSSRAPLAMGCEACWGAHYLVLFGKYKVQPGEDEMFERVLRNAAGDKREWDVQLLPQAEFTRVEEK